MRWILALSSLIVAAAAQAGDPQAVGKPGRHTVDANSDGIVTREEARRFRASPPISTRPMRTRTASSTRPR